MNISWKSFLHRIRDSFRSIKPNVYRAARRVPPKAATALLLVAIFCAAGLAAFWWNSQTLALFPPGTQEEEVSEKEESETVIEVPTEPEDKEEPETVQANPVLAIQEPEPEPVADELPAVTSLVSPVAGEPSVGYGWRLCETHEDWRFHPGYDYQVPLGTAVRAAAVGQVSKVKEDLQWGWYVVIQHGDDLETRYMGLSESAVSAGDSVTAGQVLGQIGEPGLAEVAQGPHLHFEVRRDGEPVDPQTLLQ